MGWWNGLHIRFYHSIEGEWLVKLTGWSTLRPSSFFVRYALIKISSAMPDGRLCNVAYSWRFFNRRYETQHFSLPRFEVTFHTLVQLLFYVCNLHAIGGILVRTPLKYCHKMHFLGVLLENPVSDANRICLFQQSLKNLKLVGAVWPISRATDCPLLCGSCRPDDRRHF